jgi:esterase/lipase
MMSKRTIRKIAIALLIIFLFTVVFVESFYAHLGFTQHSYYESIEDATEYDLVVEERDLITEDNFKIHIYDVNVDNPNGVVIMLTGILGPSVTKFYGQAKLVSEKGFAAVLIDARGHGKSDGTRPTLAVNDIKDVNAVVKYIESKPQYKDLPIVIMGVSMGGSTAVNAASLNPSIDGLISISPFSSWIDVCLDMIAQTGIPRWLGYIFVPAIVLCGIFTCGWDFLTVSPKQTIEQIGDKPIMFMRSTGDTTTPIQNHYRIMNHYKGDNVTEFIRESDDHFVVKDDRIYAPFEDKEFCNAILTFLDQFIPEASKPQLSPIAQ